MNWVKLKRYCELSGDTSDAVHAKRRKGVFVDGVHCKVGPDGNLWVNTTAVEQWVTSSVSEQSAQGQGSCNA